jgi:hypothetical protein
VDLVRTDHHEKQSRCGDDELWRRFEPRQELLTFEAVLTGNPRETGRHGAVQVNRQDRIVALAFGQMGKNGNDNGRIEDLLVLENGREKMLGRVERLQGCFVPFGRALEQRREEGESDLANGSGIGANIRKVGGVPVLESGEVVCAGRVGRRPERSAAGTE